MFLERSRQKILDAIKGQESERKLIDLLPTKKLKRTFHEVIESYLKGNCEEKALSRDEFENLLVRKLLELTNPNSEYDILLFYKVRKQDKLFLSLIVSCLLKETSTVYHFESKAMALENTDDKSLNQLAYV